ncbi:hypothetical protein HN935_03545 [archaeon]|jgi:hypothetical protein|nr:hypothetical protein [archaeon]
MKKNLGVFAFLTILSAAFVSAGPTDGVRQLLDGLREVAVIVIQFVTDIILDINTFDEFLFAKLILFTIILLVVFTVIKQNKVLGGNKNKTIQWIVSISVSVLAVRFLPNEFVQAILLQYGALAVGITVFLPLLIFFFFIHQSNVGPFGRRAGWVIFALSFFAIWSFRYQDLGDANMIYWIAIAFIVISLIFDKSIHKYFGLSDFRKVRASHKSKMGRQIMRDLHILDEDLANGNIEQSEYDRVSADLKARAAKLKE